MIVLDTHATVWWVSSPSRLSKRAANAIRRADRIGVPAICLFEIASLVAKERIGLDRPSLVWLEQALALPRVDICPLTPAVAVRAAQLVGLPDPADRLIVATALVEESKLVTRDVPIRELGVVQTVW